MRDVGRQPTDCWVSRGWVDALLFIGRTGCQWRCLPERYRSWTAVWAEWRRWPANGVWARAMERLAAIVRVFHDPEPFPSMIIVDARTVKGARYGPTFHQAGGRGGRTIGTKRTLVVDPLGLPLAARADSARPHDVVAAREMLVDAVLAARVPDVRADKPVAAPRAGPERRTACHVNGRIG